jgi:hypothetical protein
VSDHVVGGRGGEHGVLGVLDRDRRLQRLGERLGELLQARFVEISFMGRRCWASTHSRTSRFDCSSAMVRC